MKRALLLAGLAALLMAPVAEARRGDYFHTDDKRAVALENKINSYRIHHGLWTLSPSGSLYSAAWGINWENYKTGQIDTNLWGTPFYIWIDAFLEPSQLWAGMNRRGKCHGWDGNVHNVMHRWKKSKRARKIMLAPGAFVIGVHTSVFKRHKGDFKGKGRCIHYSAVIAN